MHRQISNKFIFFVYREILVLVFKIIFQTVVLDIEFVGIAKIVILMFSPTCNLIIFSFFLLAENIKTCHIITLFSDMIISFFGINFVLAFKSLFTQFVECDFGHMTSAEVIIYF